MLTVLFEDEMDFWSQSILLQRSNPSTSMIYLKEVFCLGGLEIAISVINLHFNYLEPLACFEVNQDTSSDSDYSCQHFFDWGLQHICKPQNLLACFLGHHSCAFTCSWNEGDNTANRVKVAKPHLKPGLTVNFFPTIWRYADKKNQ